MKDESRRPAHDHDSLADDLPLFASGDLDEDRTREIRTHVASCDTCRDRLAECRATLAVLRAADDTQAVVPDAVEAFDGRAIVPPAAGRVTNAWRWGVAAAVLLAFSAGIFVERFVIATAPTEVEREPAPVQVRTAQIPRDVTEEEIERFLRNRGGASRLSAGLALIAARSNR